jgi:hypothetical protein
MFFKSSKSNIRAYKPDIFTLNDTAKKSINGLKRGEDFLRLTSNCTLRRYNYPGSKAPKCCGKHKKEGMIEIKLPKCEKCNKLARYVALLTRTPLLTENSPDPRFCKTHVEFNMVSIM